MKVAVIVSGIPRCGVGDDEHIFEDFQRDKKSRERAFSKADFYYTTWYGYQDKVIESIGIQPITFKEPKVKYHPFYDMASDLVHSERIKYVLNVYPTVPYPRQDRFAHQTKQILAHAYACEYLNVSQEYDVVIRARYDTYVYSKADFSNIIRLVYESQNAVGFAYLGDGTNFHVLNEIPKHDTNREKFLFDSMIIHSSKVFDPQYVYKLHNEQRLLPCEFGWYQTMSMPYGDNHICYNGWAQANRYVPEHNLKEEL